MTQKIREFCFSLFHSRDFRVTCSGVSAAHKLAMQYPLLLEHVTEDVCIQHVGMAFWFCRNEIDFITAFISCPVTVVWTSLLLKNAIRIAHCSSRQNRNEGVEF